MSKIDFEGILKTHDEALEQRKETIKSLRVEVRRVIEEEMKEWEELPGYMQSGALRACNSLLSKFKEDGKNG